MKKYTVTIGVPAYNEEKNIGQLLSQLINQKGNNFIIEYIYVLSDCSSDKTDNIVRLFESKNSVVKLISSARRHGKVYQLNRLYKLSKSDFLFNFDADIKIKDKYLISKVVNQFQSDKSVEVIAIHQIPIRPKTLMGKIIYAGYEFWDEARLSVAESDNIQNLYGAATAYRSIFTNSFLFPNGITDDRGYLYLKAKNNNSFSYYKGSNIYYLPVSTLHDFRKLADRSFSKNRAQLQKYTNLSVEEMYKIPFGNKIKAIIHIFFKEPVYCFLALLLNIYTRLFPLHDNLYESNMWEISQSTKNFN